MKTKFSFIILLIFSKIIFAQNFDFSICPFITIQSKNLENSYGLQIGGEYYYKQLFSLKMSAGVFSPDNNLEEVFIANIPTDIAWLDFMVKIYPLQTDIKPYIGVGLGKYFLSRKWNGHSHENNGVEVFVGNLENKFGFPLILGCKLNKNIYIELKYILLSTTMKREANFYAPDYSAHKFVKEKLDVNLNTLLIMIGFSF